MPKFQDLTGERFDRLVVLSRVPKENATYWLCLCDCGNEVKVRAGNLRSGQVRSCGCLQRESVTVTDMIGQQFGRLTAMERAPSTGHKAMWLFQCECGNEVILPGERVRAGRTKSCGCQRSDSAKLTNLKHGHARDGAKRHPMYKRWESIKQRCTNPNNPRWKDYGGRGIKLCDEWLNDFAQFLADVGEPPAPHLTLDRIDNDGNYEPSNIRWATHSTQMINRRPFRDFTSRCVDHLEGLGCVIIWPGGELR